MEKQKPLHMGQWFLTIMFKIVICISPPRSTYYHFHITKRYNFREIHFQRVCRRHIMSCSNSGTVEKGEMLVTIIFIFSQNVFSRRVLIHGFLYPPKLCLGGIKESACRSVRPSVCPSVGRSVAFCPLSFS